jgi:hypothetical protein
MCHRGDDSIAGCAALTSAGLCGESMDFFRRNLSTENSSLSVPMREQPPKLWVQLRIIGALAPRGCVTECQKKRAEVQWKKWERRFATAGTAKLCRVHVRC